MDDYVPQYYGPAFYTVEEREDGTMWIHNGEYISQVNFDPITGREANTKITNFDSYE